ncbi:TonB-dependent receptor [Acinetobacter qingfengensis]|uniref:Ligand-gated channel protein n=1 Tax=Acinetobacter qingfengensis TaxID=1262585 RepID=A0A1E7QXH0_9GAMM|nr:TonB-dependent receptor [Acinetobacter qingfengensis]KAA8731646.1 TonB-dependent receptor [Acinetobacter qingfengensis]OEY91749.1 ligand-gated channel protein [Acinetobacter qingfengensis]
MSVLFKPATLSGAILLALISSTSFAAEQINQLDPIVVTASKTEEKVSEVPARITVISKQQIEKNPALNLSDVLQKDASIYVKQSGGIGQLTDLSLRGGRTGSTLLLKNGARLNSQNGLGPVTPEFIDLSNIDQIEILKGPASVQYGSDASSGVIQLISQKPLKTGASLSGIYGENNTYKASINADYVNDNGFYVSIGGQRMESDGTSVIDIQAKNQKAAFDQKGYNAQIGYINNIINTSLSIDQNQGTNIYTTNYTTNNARRNFENRLINWLGSYNIISNLTLNARYSHSLDKSEQVIYGNHFNTTSDEGDLNAKWHFTNHQNLLSGVTYNRSEYNASSSPESVRTISSTGYYLQHQYDNNGIHTQAGLRVEDNDWFGTHTVGQAAIRYQILPLTSIYANIGTAFKAPTLEHLYGSYGYDFYSNPNLKPEESTSYEIGLDQKFNYGLSAYISTYYTDAKNLMAFGTINNQSTYVNINRANIKGGELGFKWSGDNVFASAEYTYVIAQNKNSKEDIAYRPRQTYTLTAGYDDGKYGVNTSLVSRSKANTGTSGVKVPGYATVDINAFWNVNSNIRLFTNIQNIGDVRYPTVYNSPSSWSPEYWYINGGRQASVGVTLKY